MGMHRILHFAAKQESSDLPQMQSRLSAKVVIDCTTRIVSIFAHDGELKGTFPLSSPELTTLLIFYENFPAYVPDGILDLGKNKYKSLHPLRIKLRSLGLTIERIRAVGYFLADAPTVQTTELDRGAAC